MDTGFELFQDRPITHFGLSSLLSVLWRPQWTLAAKQTAPSVAALIFFIFAIDFVLALILVPTVFDSIGKAASTANIGGNARVFAVGVAVIIGSLADIALIAFMALLFLFILLILDGKATYREIIGALLIASSPSIIDRVQRLFAFFFHITQHPMDNVFSVSRLFFVDNSVWLDNVTIFDIWTFLLVFIGIHKISGLRLQWSFLSVLLLWGGMELLMLRLQLAGGIG
jgi:hypothetical protein